MSQDLHLLNEFVETGSPRKRFIKPLVVVIIVYMLIVLIATFVDINQFGVKIRLRESDVSFLLTILMFPIVGLFFLLRKMQVGWVICFSYFASISMLISISIVSVWYDGDVSGFSIAHIVMFGCMFALSLASSVLLLLKDVRNHLRVQRTGLLFAFFICIAVATLFVTVIVGNA